jgi:hypothetical protein
MHQSDFATILWEDVHIIRTEPSSSIITMSGVGEIEVSGVSSSDSESSIESSGSDQAKKEARQARRLERRIAKKQRRFQILAKLPDKKSRSDKIAGWKEKSSQRKASKKEKHGFRRV